MPHFQPKTQLLGHQDPPPGPAGGQGPPVPECVPTPRYRGAPHSPGSACCEVCRQRGGKKIWGGGDQDRFGGSSSQPRAPCHTRLCPAAEENGLTLQKCWSQVAPTVMSFSKTQPRSPAEHPLGTEGGGTGPQGLYGALGGAQPSPGYPHHHQRKKEQGEEGCLVVSFSLLLTFLFGINTIWSPELRPFWLGTSFGISPPGRRRSTRTKRRTERGETKERGEPGLLRAQHRAPTSPQDPWGTRPEVSPLDSARQPPPGGPAGPRPSRRTRHGFGGGTGCTEDTGAVP